MKQSRLAFSLIAAFAFTLTPARADERDPFDGLYMGLHGGYSWQDVSGVFDNAGTATNLAGIDRDGGVIGGQLGYNLQYDWVVLGVEGDASALTGSSGSVTNPANNAVLSGDASYLASIRSRLGFVIGDVMLYGTAGIAFTEFKFTENAQNVPFYGTLRLKENGAVYGGGLEWKFAYGLSLRGEYLHYDVSSSSYLPGNFPNVDGGDIVGFHDINVARAGVNISLNP